MGALVSHQTKQPLEYMLMQNYGYLLKAKIRQTRNKSKK